MRALLGPALHFCKVVVLTFLLRISPVTSILVPPTLGGGAGGVFRKPNIYLPQGASTPRYLRVAVAYLSQEIPSPSRTLSLSLLSLSPSPPPSLPLFLAFSLSRFLSPKP